MLKAILIANAVSCLGFGAVFAAFPASISAFLGSPPTWVLVLLGTGLILNGLNLLWVARKDRPGRKEVLQFVLGDALWVIATLALITLGIWITTSAGAIASLLVGAWVAACGMGQYIYLPDARTA